MIKSLRIENNLLIQEGAKYFADRFILRPLLLNKLFKVAFHRARKSNMSGSSFSQEKGPVRAKKKRDLGFSKYALFLDIPGIQLHIPALARNPSSLHTS